MVSRSRRHVREVPIAPVSPDRFQEVLEVEEWRQFQQALARGGSLLSGRVVWNVNSTSAGGGVAEMLRSLMAYASGAGVDARWVAVAGTPDFFQLTKRIHNQLHGDPGDGGALAQRERTIYEENSWENAALLAEIVDSRDIVILHDPQTLGMIEWLEDTGATIIWRSHIGTEEPNEFVGRAWEFLYPYAQKPCARVFSRYAYVPEGLRDDLNFVIAPSIDPFSPKNQDMEDDRARSILNHIGLLDGGPTSVRPTFMRVDGSVGHVTRRCRISGSDRRVPPEVPLIVQVSRWDRLKDPVGVLEGFVGHVANRSAAHLVLAGPSVDAVADDPEGRMALEGVASVWAKLPPAVKNRVHLACLPMDDLAENAAIVNALQRCATILVQKSVREGFGLTVTEAMWKAKPVVGADIGGIRKQIDHDISGILVRDPHDLVAFGDVVVALLNDGARANRLGECARQTVRQRFLHSSHLSGWVNILEEAMVLGSAEG